MKKLSILTLLLCIASLAIAQDKGDATVNQEQGKYIFINSRPKAEYTFLGSMKISIAWTGAGEEMVNIALKKALKKFPEADGIVFTRLNLDRMDVIKFK